VHTKRILKKNKFIYFGPGLAFVLYLLFFLVSPTNAADISSTPIPADYFGMHYYWSDTSWPSVSFGAVRFWQNEVAWKDISPSSGTYDWAKLDTRLGDAEQHNADVTYVFGDPPAWAVPGGECSGDFLSSDGLMCTKTPNISDWDNFVTAVVTHANGRIKYWEIWNEFNWSIKDVASGVPPLGYHIDTVGLATMAQHAYNIIKSIDPDAVVLAPSVGGYNAGLLECYLKPVGVDCTNSSIWGTGAGGAAYADVIAVHLYDGRPAENIVEKNIPGVNSTEISAYRAEMERAGVAEKPLWDTEGNWYDQEKDPADLLNASSSDAAAYVARSYLLRWSEGISRFYWFGWEMDPNYGGLWDGNSKSIYPTGTAYGEVYKWMVGATMKSPCASSGGVWECDFTRPNGYEARAVWSPDGSQQYDVPSQFSYYRDLAGSIHLVSDGQVDIGPSPILIETPVIISDGEPSGTLPSNTTQTELSLSTNRDAACRYSLSAGTAYEDMLNVFSTTGGTAHSTTVTGLSNGATFHYYVRCREASLNINTTEYVLSFSVAESSDDTPQAVSISRPGLQTDDKTQDLSHDSTVHFSSHTLVFKGETSGLANGRVDIYAGKEKAGTATISEGGQWSKSIHLKKDGTYQISFRYYDQAGNLIKTSSSSKVEVDTESPKFTDLPRFLTKRPGQQIFWKAKDNTAVKYSKYTFSGRMKKTTSSHFLLSSSISRGRHILRVKIFDRAGNYSSRKVVVNVV